MRASIIVGYDWFQSIEGVKLFGAPFEGNAEIIRDVLSASEGEKTASIVPAVLTNRVWGIRGKVRISCIIFLLQCLNSELRICD